MKYIQKRTRPCIQSDGCASNYYTAFYKASLPGCRINPLLGLCGSVWFLRSCHMYSSRVRAVKETRFVLAFLFIDTVSAFPSSPPASIPCVLHVTKPNTRNEVHQEKRLFLDYINNANLPKGVNRVQSLIDTFHRGCVCLFGLLDRNGPNASLLSCFECSSAKHSELCT